MFLIPWLCRYIFLLHIGKWLKYVVVIPAYLIKNVDLLLLAIEPLISLTLLCRDFRYGGRDFRLELLPQHGVRYDNQDVADLPLVTNFGIVSKTGMHTVFKGFQENGENGKKKVF